jgi:hypothetical protein
VIVVRTGPEATAGSALKPFSTSGTVPPIDTAMTVLRASAKPTTSPPILLQDGIIVVVQVVHADNFMAFVQKALGHMEADEAGGAG